MRVLVIAKDFPAPGQPEGGIVVIRQVQALAELGHEIRVARVVPYAPNWTTKWRAYRAIPDTYTIEDITVETVRAFFPPRMLGMEYLPLQVGGALRRLADRFAPDVIHAHCLIPSGQLAVGLNRPAVITAHGSDAYDWAWRRNGLRRAAVEGITRAGAVVAVSEFIRHQVCALYERNVAVVYNGADERTFSPSDRAAARRELGITGDRFTIAFAGRPPRNKGAFDLIEAVARLRDLHPLVLMAGPNDSDTELAAAIAQSSVEARVCGMLTHPELARVLAASDVFCLPSYREGLPLVVCEAMLSARPVVATPVGGIPEIVSDGVHGHLVPASDVTQLAQRLRNIAENPEHAAQMGENAFAFARAHLTWRANARAYEELYRRVCTIAA